MDHRRGGRGENPPAQVLVRRKGASVVEVPLLSSLDGYLRRHVVLVPTQAVQQKNERFLRVHPGRVRVGNINLALRTVEFVVELHGHRTLATYMSVTTRT